MPFEPIRNNKWGFYNENYHIWLKELFTKMTSDQRAKIPHELLHKFSKGVDYALNVLTDDQIKHILSVAFGKISIVIFEDQDAGMSVKQWHDLYHCYRSKGRLGDLVDSCRTRGMFFLGNHDLMKYLSFLNFVHCSNLYKLAKDFDKMPRSGRRLLTGKVRDTEDARMNILKMLMHMEANRQRIKLDYDITQPQWYALIYFSYHSQATSIAFYDHFKYAMASSRINLKIALTELKRKGHIDYIGSNVRYTKYYLTDSGRQIVDKILSRLVLGY